MTDDAFSAKKRINEALEALRIAVTPYVSQRMEGAFGNKWRSNAIRAIDSVGLLNTVLDNWREVFSADEKLRRARDYIFLARKARHAVSHFEGTIRQREALRHLDAILEVLGAIGAKVQEEIVVKLYREQQSGGGSTGGPTRCRTKIGRDTDLRRFS